MGIFPENTGKTLIEGTLRDIKGVTSRWSDPGPKTQTGTPMFPEFLIPSPEKQVDIDAIYDVDF